MNANSERESIKVNEMLGKQAAVGPLPANQIIPFGVIIIGSFAVLEGFLGLGLPVVFFVSFWMGSSWWLLTGKSPDDYINLFRKPSERNWITGGTVYISPLLSRQQRRNIKQKSRAITGR
jgi:hypothetical protein